MPSSQIVEMQNTYPYHADLLKHAISGSIQSTASYPWGPNSLEENNRASTSAVEGRITDMRSFLTPNGTPYTMVDITISRVLKGDTLSAGGQASVVIAGGRIPLREFIEANGIGYLFNDMGESEIEATILDIPLFRSFNCNIGAEHLFLIVEADREPFASGSYHVMMVLEGIGGGMAASKTPEGEIIYSMEEIESVIKNTYPIE